MAQKVHVVLVDDIDESEATQNVKFGLDGVDYHIDLNDTHANELREALALYIAHGRKLGGRKRRGQALPAATATPGHSPREIRDWARSNGYTVPDRGRIPAEIRQAFLDAKG